MSMTQQEAAQIQDAAERARRAGMSRLSCPRYPNTRSGDEKRDLWYRSFDAENDRRNRKPETA